MRKIKQEENAISQLREWIEICGQRGLFLHWEHETARLYWNSARTLANIYWHFCFVLMYLCLYLYCFMNVFQYLFVSCEVRGHCLDICKQHWKSSINCASRLLPYRSRPVGLRECVFVHVHPWPSHVLEKSIMRKGWDGNNEIRVLI